MLQPAIDVIVVNYLTPELAAVAVTKVCGPGVDVHVYDNSGAYVAGAGATAALIASCSWRRLSSSRA
jgi:hypothetical protein